MGSRVGFLFYPPPPMLDTLKNWVLIMDSSRQYDPWITESVSSPFRPCGPKQSTPEAPVYILPNASHCFDLNLRNARLDEGVQDAIDKALAQMKVWLDEWYAQVDRE